MCYLILRREFTTAGVAGGVSAGFNAPIGGLLFAMEDLSSFWTKASSWQTFFCCVIATIVAELINTAFSGFIYQTGVQFGTLTESVCLPSMTADAVLMYSASMHILHIDCSQAKSVIAASS
jgi:H+/Cl- antiporter ClcA